LNPEEYIQIIADIPLLARYFKWPVITKDGRPWENWTIKRKYYDQIHDLLSKYGIQDQRYIDTFCFLEMITWGMHWTAKGQDLNNEGEIWRFYYLDHSKFGRFIENYNIKSIHFTGDSKITGAMNPGSVTLNSSQFIKDFLYELTSMMEGSKVLYHEGYGERWKRKSGAEMKPSGSFIWNTFFRLRNFLHDLPFPELNDLSETEENYFAGRFFSIAGIIKPKPYTKHYKHKTERYYLNKTMQNLRSP